MDHSKILKVVLTISERNTVQIYQQNTQIQLKLIILEKLTPRGLHSLRYPLSPDQR